MGRIKSLMIKRAAKKLLEDKESFSESFEHNKKRLKDTMPSKPIRNKVAGYISRLVRMQKESLTKVKKVVKEEVEELPQYEQY